MKRKVTLLTCLMLVALSIGQVVYAHSGKLDSSGGHKDNKNINGLGSYHYHCGDYPAHLHGSRGLCKYSNEYKEYMAIVDELKTYVDKTTSDKKGEQAFSILTEDDIKRMETLLQSEFMPFMLTNDVLNAETTLFGKTNVKGLNVRKKQSSSSAKVCGISVTGTRLLITEDMGNGWYSIMVFEDNKSQTGYVKKEMVDLIEKPEYLISLCENL